MFTLTYEYKLKPTKKQIEDIEHILMVCRKVWNYALCEKKDWIQSRKCRVDACSLEYEYIVKADEPFPSYQTQAKRLTEAKRENEELRSVNAQVLQQVLRNLEKSFENMRSRNFGFPRFKNSARMRSFVFPQLKGEILKGSRIKLPQLGWVKLRLSRLIPQGFVVKQARVVRKASGYFAQLAIQLDVKVPDVPNHGYPLGIDIGLDQFLATSDGELVARPKFFKSLHRKLKLLQRRLKYKKLGSSNRRQLNAHIARLHQKISDTRKDFHFKTAHHLCKGAGAIFVEDIDFRSWASGMFCKHTLDAGFGQFFGILSYVAWKTDTYFGKVDKDYTSQICPNCGCHTGKKTLDIRIHNCPECRYTTHRDVAAAQVIRNRGISAVGQPVEQIACRGVLTGASSNISLVKCH